MWMPCILDDVTRRHSTCEVLLAKTHNLSVIQSTIKNTLLGCGACLSSCQGTRHKEYPLSQPIRAQKVTFNEVLWGPREAFSHCTMHTRLVLLCGISGLRTEQHPWPLPTPCQDLPSCDSHAYFQTWPIIPGGGGGGRMASR
jgi:hypothetical protein